VITKEDIADVFDKAHNQWTLIATGKLFNILIAERDDALAELQMKDKFLRDEIEFTKRLISERDEALARAEAYRKVAIKIPGPLITSLDREWIDTEAARILAQRKEESK